MSDEEAGQIEEEDGDHNSGIELSVVGCVASLLGLAALVILWFGAMHWAD